MLDTQGVRRRLDKLDEYSRVLHSAEEERLVTIGQPFRRRILVVVHTDRGDNIRIISARVATRRERETYEKSDQF